MIVLVTGATGTTGSRLVPLLLDQVFDPVPDGTVEVRRASRSSSVHLDWSVPETHDAAFADVDRAYLVPPVETTEPADLVAPALERAVARGLRRVVLLSSSAVDRSTTGVGALHDLVMRVVPEPVVLRPAWFAQNFLGDHPTAQGLRAGELVTATGDGRVPFVDAGDIAAVAAVSLLADDPPGPELVVTGPEALSYADVCALHTEVTGHPARHLSVSPEKYAEYLTDAGMPADFATVLAGLDALIASGAQAQVTDTVERLTGRRPRTVREVLEHGH